MRRFSVARGVGVLSFAVFVVLSASALQNVAETREQPRQNERTVAKIVRVIKKSLRSLGDGLTGPRP